MAGGGGEAWSPLFEKEYLPFEKEKRFKLSLRTDLARRYKPFILQLVKRLVCLLGEMDQELNFSLWSGNLEPEPAEKIPCALEKTKMPVESILPKVITMRF